MSKQRTVSFPSGEGGTVDGIGSAIAHWLNAGELPPELVTGHQMIDMEHRFLIAAMANLRRVCKDCSAFDDCISCGAMQQARCENNLISLLGDVFSFILDHFSHEEEVMRHSTLLVVDNAVCQAHIEDHAEIATKVQQVVSSLDSSQVVSRIRELDALLGSWVTHHVAMHDMLLSRWVARYETQLNAFGY